MATEVLGRTDPRAPRGATRPGVDAHGVLVAVAVVVAALGALGADGSPTGRPALDAAWRVGLAVVVVLAAAAPAPGWSLLVLCAPGVLLARTAEALLVSAAVFGAATWCATRRTPSRPAAAAVAAAGVQLLLRLPTDGPALLGAALAALAVLPLVVGAALGLPAAERAVLRRAAQLAALVVVIGGALAIGGVLRASDEMEAGAREAADALDAAGDGDQLLAAEGFDSAAERFDAASAVLESPLVELATALPLVGPQVDLVAASAQGGHDVVASAGDVARATDLEDLRLRDGTIDVRRVAAAEAPLAIAAASLDDAIARLEVAASPWAIPPVRAAADGLQHRLGRAVPDAALALELSRVGPALLGAQGARRYLVLFTSPAEARELGGFTAAWAELTIDDGDLELVDTGRATDLNDPDGLAGRSAPAGMPERLRRYEPERYFQNVTGIADFPAAAAVAVDVWEQAGRQPVDGVLAMDPAALAALLELTGPVRIAGVADPIDGQHAEALLLRDQYVQHPDRAERTDFLVEVAERTFERLSRGALPGPRRIGRVLGPAARSRRLLAWSPVVEEQAAFVHLGMDGAMPDAGGGDLLSVTHANANPSKIDTFLHRRIEHDVTFDPVGGAVEATTRITLRNDAPTSGLPDYVLGGPITGRPRGTNHLLLSVASPHEVVGATLDGSPVTLERTEELGLVRWSTFVDVPAGTTVVVEVRSVGVMAAGSYRLRVVGQPLANADELLLDVRTGEGERPASIGLVRRWGSRSSDVPDDEVPTVPLQVLLDGDLELHARFDG